MSIDQRTSFAVTVDEEGKVVIPGTHPGDEVVVTVWKPSAGERPLSEAEKSAALERVAEIGRKRRAESTPEERERAVNHGDWLYDERGLPK